MQNTASSLLFSYFDTIEDVGLPDLRKQALILVMGIMACAVQVSMIFVYAGLNCLPMVICAGLGAISSAICCMFAKQQHFTLAGLLMTGGIVLVVAADDYFVGVSNNSMLYLFAVLAINLQIPYKQRWISIGLSIFLPVLMAGLYLMGLAHVPPYYPGEIMRVFAVINILATTMGTSVIVWIARTINHYADAYSAKQIETLETQTYRAALTKMYNRHYATQYFERMAKAPASGPACIAIVDVDDFKKVNDPYGHDTGDVTLCEVSRLMRENLRQSDLVIRWGGEEFVLILQDVEPLMAYDILDNIRLLLAGHEISHDAHRFHVTATFGLSVLDAADYQSGIKACDEKLYEGKRTTKNVVVL